MSNHGTGAVVAVLSLWLMTGCASPAAAPTGAAATSVPPPRAATGTYPTATPGAIDDDTLETITAAPSPTWDASSRTTAATAAEAAMRTFARPSLSAQSWWRALAPLLTQQARQDYSYVDPASIPARRVTGAARILPTGSGYAAEAQVPTDAGVYTLTLTRTGPGAPWLTSRFTPPAGS